MESDSVLVMFQETDAWQESCCLNCAERLPIEEALAEVEAGKLFALLRLWRFVVPCRI